MQFWVDSLSRMLAIGMAKLEFNFPSSLTHHVQCPSKRRGMWLTEFYYPKFSPHPLTRSKCWTKNWRTNRKQMTDSLISSQSLMPLRLSDVWIFSFLFVFFSLSCIITAYWRRLRVAEEAKYLDTVLNSVHQVKTGLEILLATITDFDAFSSQVELDDQELAVSLKQQFRSWNMPRVNDLIFSFIISG